MQDQVKSNLSALKSLIEGFNYQNKRHAELSDRISGLGHSLKNTSLPEDGNEKAIENLPSGIIADLSNALEFYTTINNRLDQTVEKLIGII